MDTILPFLADTAGKCVIGDPMDPETTMGPAVNENQYSSVQAHIQSGIDEGARLVRPRKTRFGSPTIRSMDWRLCLLRRPRSGLRDGPAAKGRTYLLQRHRDQFADPDGGIQAVRDRATDGCLRPGGIP